MIFRQAFGRFRPRRPVCRERHAGRASQIVSSVVDEVGAGEQHEVAIGHDTELGVTQIDAGFDQFGHAVPLGAVDGTQNTNGGGPMAVSFGFTESAPPGSTGVQQIGEGIVWCVVPDPMYGQQFNHARRPCSKEACQ